MQFGWKQITISLGVFFIIGAGFIFGPDTVFRYTETVLDSDWFPVLLVGLYILRPFLAWPLTALSVLVGYQYGLLLGIPIALLGAVGSTLIPYGGMRYFEFDSGLLEWATEESEDYFSTTGDLRGLIAARLAPIPAEATSIAAGASDVHPATFVLGTTIGEIPWTIAAVTVGHSMYRLTLSDISLSPWLLAVTTLAALALIAGPVYRLYKQSRRRAATEETVYGSRGPSN